MNTSKPIAGISYNTESYLAGKIKDWHKAGIIEFGAYIKHKKEVDEKKEHFHVFLKPAKRLQTMDLENDSAEFDPTHPDKPLKLIGLSPSKESEWIMYCLHDPVYLMEKGLERVHHYSLEDFKTTDNDLFDIMVSQIGDTRNGKIEYRILQMINRGMSWPEMLSSGLIPMRYIYSAKIMYDSLKYAPKKRNNCPDVDDESEVAVDSDLDHRLEHYDELFEDIVIDDRKSLNINFL